MTRITLTTFNCENLMMRCDFSSIQIPNVEKKLTAVSDPGEAENVDAVFDVLSEDDRTLTAQALSAAQADVCCLQEVENLVALTAFHNRYLRRWSRKGYPHRVLKEGNDSRGIDVALLSRATPMRVVSHADATFGSLGMQPLAGAQLETRVFRRDCLEVEIIKDGKALTLFVCHFKSMNGSREVTHPVRLAEAEAVRRLIEARFDDPAKEDWAVLGDFNDYLEVDGDLADDHSLGPLVNDGFSVDALMALEPDPLKRWTHYYAGGGTYSALDHIFLSPALARRNKQAGVRIIRGGQPLRAQRYDGRRFPGVGWSIPKASDHCPLSITLTL